MLRGQSCVFGLCILSSRSHILGIESGVKPTDTALSEVSRSLLRFNTFFFRDWSTLNWSSNINGLMNIYKLLEQKL
jgi:hypothetical protein